MFNEGAPIGFVLLFFVSFLPFPAKKESHRRESDS